MVHLKRITLQGFKSFPPKRQTIELVKGLVVIAGPNGSGKSNIIDAIRFAFGELSPHALRVSRMSELINQSEAGGTAQFARVTVVLENSERAIPLDADEVTVTRRLYASGESEYAVNNRTVGRSDVLGLLAAANVRPSGFNVVSQGAVLGIAEMGPEDLKELIEEVAGTAEFDQRKQEAMKELEKADRNVAVAKAGAEEVRRRLVQLELEWFNLSRRRHLERELEFVKRREVVSEISKIDQELLKVFEKIATLQEVRSKKERELERLSKELFEAERLDGSLRSEEAAIQSEIRRLSNELELARNSLERLRTKMRDSGQRYAEVRRRAMSIRSSVVAEVEQARVIREKLASLDKTAAELSQQLKGVEEELREVSSNVEQLRSKLEKYEEAQRMVSAERRRLQQELSKVDSELARLRSEEARLSARIESLQLESKLRAEELKRVREELTSLSSLRTEVKRRLEGGVRLVADLDRKSQDLERERSQIMVWLREAEEALATVRQESSKRSSEMTERLREVFGERVVGVLGELVSFPEETRVLYERLLGELMNAWVFRRNSDALAAVLAASELDLNLYAISIEGRGNCYRRKGRCLACAADVKSHEARAALHVALSGAEIVVSDDFSVSRPAVTARGAHHNGQGVFASLGGVVSESETFEEAKAIREMVVSLRDRLKATEVELERLRGEVSAVREAESELRGELRSIDSREFERKELEKKLLSELKRIEAESSRVESASSELQSRVATLVSRREELEKALQEIISPDQPEQERKELLQQSELQFHLISERSRLIAELKRHTDQSSSLRRELAALEGRVADVPARIEELEKAAALHLDRVRSAALEYADTLKSVREREAELSRLEDHLQRLRSESVGLSERVRALREERDRVGEELARVDSDLESWKLSRVELSSRRNALEERLQGGEVLVQEVAFELPQPVLEEFRSSMERELQELELVNQLAPMQYVEVSSTYRQKSIRISELEVERNEILKLIEEIDAQKLKVVTETIRKVSEEFGEYFNRLTGGDGWLEFTDPQSPLESGIEMVVRFPGKAPRSARGVSGGEKTVSAVALLLSLQSLTPADFLVFDEVDAHLDAAYSSNLAELLKEMSKKIQIILVSLKDIVAEKADLLIGVYGRSGASHVITTKLGELLEGEQGIE
ncbi:MAG: chromosome segregation protein SMC [Thaumarchaeota archaeon]|nr:chromosome segregation protein SMC [Candidatus Calditenuaceae archaeon]MDW8186899.1 chromosome segregation SMC family protein [Nitrososphaerota archaeon]